MVRAFCASCYSGLFLAADAPAGNSCTDYYIFQEMPRVPQFAKTPTVPGVLGEQTAGLEEQRLHGSVQGKFIMKRAATGAYFWVASPRDTRPRS